MMLDALLFYCPHTNWHKLPLVRDLLCWLGRHDFEFDHADGDSAVLVCFYCERQRSSHKGTTAKYQPLSDLTI